MAPITEAATSLAGLTPTVIIIRTAQIIQIIITQIAGDLYLAIIITIPIIHLMSAQVGAIHLPITPVAVGPEAVLAAAVVVV